MVHTCSSGSAQYMIMVSKDDVSHARVLIKGELALRLNLCLLRSVIEHIVWKDNSKKQLLCSHAGQRG